MDAGVDCYSDTLLELAARGGVSRIQESGVEQWELTPGARTVLNSCTVGRRLDGAAEVQVDRSRVFCVMPFSMSWSDSVWESCIEPASKRAGLNPIRGDTTLRTGKLIQNVWNQILECGCVIADLTEPNANVYYELGMAHALGRDTFVMIQKNVDLPADLKGSHYVEYDAGNLPQASQKLEQQLTEWKEDDDVRVGGVEALF